MIEGVDGYTVYYDDPLGEISKKTGKVKRKSKEFRGRGCKGRATAFLNTVTNYNGELKPCTWLILGALK